MEPQRRYSQTVKKAFHISMAALDESTSDDSPTQVICSYDDRNYLLCTLEKGKTTQVALDLNYEVGDKISFATNGKAHVHLTGYLLEEQFGLGEDGEEEEDVEEDDEAVVESAIGTKRQKKDSPNSPDLILGEDSEDSSSDEQDELIQETKKVMENGIASKKQKKKQEKAKETQQKSPVQQPKNEKQTRGKLKGDKTPAKNEKQEKTPVKGDKTPAKGESKKTPAKSPKQEGGSPQKKTIEGGVIIEDVRVGNGPLAKPGKFVKVYYEGRFKNNNKMFDSTTKGPGFEFRLGRQEVIKGWDVGLAGMKVGGKRRIICPPNMAYGQKGSPPTIPPNSTLVLKLN
ncbi:fkbp-type peptidyl-prolyl cis-trans isomerase fkpa [Holotrichia oblita]|uniref:Fkbp-type peptidyl-prolyl cis-trans isomerase fkpa n=1 Tax=Holotrichia oblita TaxID=644536 RepID=A0ACB9SZY6_HOLOL|nr:fkbp-type peptidyl-prolyl cis-trans isomerase fkpa [Holotrichia oblita]